MLSTRGAAEPGRYRTSRTEYVRDIMDDLSADSVVQTVVWMKAAQVGASEAGNNLVGYWIDHAPGPILLVQPTVDLAKRYSRQRLEPLIETSERVKQKVSPAKSRDSSNTMLMKEFLGGILVITGANSAVGLRSMPVRYLFLDEVDAYAGDVEEEGDPVALAEARQRTFGKRAKTFIPSTPKMKGTSRIARYYENSDMRKYFVPCPLCDTPQVLDFDQLRWEPGRPETVLYQCIACQGKFPEAHKTAMVAQGGWKPTRETNDPTTHGYHLSALYSPIGWLSWADIAKQWEAAVSDADLRKTFVNTVLGECWEEDADALPDWERLIERSEDRPHAVVPERGLFLTAGADVQADRIEIDVWAWGRQVESWLVEHIVVYGDTSRPETWKPVSELLSRTWEHATGARLALQRFAVDSGAYTASVYDWARRQDRQTVLCVKGVAAYDRLVPVSGPTRIDMLPNGEKLKRGVNLWTVSVSYFKKELYRNLLLSKPTDEQLASGLRYPAGYVHLLRTVPDEWVKQLVSEQQVIVRDRRGFATKTEWRQLRPRNEALDCRTYARAAAWLSGADRWSAAKWRSLEEQLGLPEPTTERVTVEVPVAVSPMREVVTEQAVNLGASDANVVLGGDIRRPIVSRRTRVRY
jgi:phage terminase large subunit GpA-like protein